MPAYAERQQLDRPRERLRALVVAVLVQMAFAIALYRGLQVEIGRPADVVQRLIVVTLPTRTPAEPPPLIQPKERPARKSFHPAPARGSGVPKPAQAPTSVVPVVAVQLSAAPPSGGSASGSDDGSGAGASAGRGEGDSGAGAGGGTELEQIAGEITPRDYPRHLGNEGIGGRVGVSFTVGVNGRVRRCTVTRSSGVPELDALTCRLILQRFRYRPSTDRYGRPIPDEVDGEHEWTAGRG